MIEIVPLYLISFFFKTIFALFCLILFKLDRSSWAWVLGLFSIAASDLITILGHRVYYISWMQIVANAIAFYGYIKCYEAYKHLVDDKSPSRSYALFVSLLFLLSLVVLLSIDFQNMFIPYSMAVWGILQIILFTRMIRLYKICSDFFMLLAGFLFFSTYLIWLIRGSLAYLLNFDMMNERNLINWVSLIALALVAIFQSINYLFLRYKLINHDKDLLEENLRLKNFQMNKILKLNKSAIAGALSGSIAHELNQPLSSLMINTHLLRRKLDQNNFDTITSNRIINQIDHDCERMSTIISNIQSIFKNLDSSSSSSKEGTRLDAALHSIYESLANDLENNSIALDKPSYAYYKIQMPQEEFEQVLRNIIFNSIQALSNSSILNPSISIDCIEKNNLLSLSVTDNGPGVIKELQDNMFELLESRKASGMGIGLWLAREIMRKHNGDIAYDGNFKNGARFLISIPLILSQGSL